MADSKIVSFEDRDSPAISPLRHGKTPPMRSDLVEKASEIVQNPPILINMVSSRVRQLNMGRPPLVRVIERMGMADIALLEIIEGKIVLDESGDGEKPE